ncbi:MAG: histidinol phosphatase [Firmicutes bacterium]|mgnify:CR=1 FL=1|nr:histidinol phosphatase [Bacillota bacterium]
MQAHKYETHTHTSEGSKCSHISAADLVELYWEHGYSGVCITDHLDYFLKGWAWVPADAPWAERVEQFCKGYENALVAGKRLGIDVFFGWEYTERGAHFVTFGLDKQWLLDHPNLLELSFHEYCTLVHSDGGFIIHAHPFRLEEWISEICLFPKDVDAVEVINACRTDFQNRLADQYADNFGLPKVAGSDNHFGPLERLAGIEVARRLAGVNDMINAIKSGQVECFVESRS